MFIFTCIRKQIGSRLNWSRNYAAKDIRFGVDARALMLRGVEELADVEDVGGSGNRSMNKEAAVRSWLFQVR